MKKGNAKFVLGATIMLATLTNAQGLVIKKSKKLSELNSISKIKDQSDNQDSISDGSKTERASSSGK